MVVEKIIIEKGTMFFISIGSHSDYEILMFCESLCKININLLRDDFFKQYNEGKINGSNYYKSFEKWLIDKHFVKKIDCLEWNIEWHFDEDLKLSEFSAGLWRKND